MKNSSSNTTRTLIVLNLAVMAVILYALSIYRAYPVFQMTRLTDPLAEWHSLDGFYYAALALAAATGVLCLLWRSKNPYLHAGLLVLFGVILWLTPYLLTSFVRLSDSSWHVGLGMKIPEILAGDKVALSWYAWAYPGSYILHYLNINVTGLQPLTYIHFFPWYALIAFVILAYVLLSRLFGRPAAFLAVLLAIPGLHYIQIHASPHATAALLMLTAFILLTRPGITAKVTACFIITITIITHPTTPVLIASFLVAALVALIIYYRKIKPAFIATAIILVFVFAGWFLAYSHSKTPAVEPITPSGAVQPAPVLETEQTGQAAGEIIGRINPAKIETGKAFLQGTPFVFKSIYNLNKAIYFIYAALVLAWFVYVALKTYLRTRNIRKWLSFNAGFHLRELILVFSLPILLILTFLLAEQAHDLIETGLTYIILVCSGLIAAGLVRARMRTVVLPVIVAVLALLFFTFTYPPVAYSIDAYSNVPASENYGLRFVAEDTSPGGKTLSGLFLYQLSMYVPPSVEKMTIVDQDSQDPKPDIVVLRNTAYYYLAIRFDYSFDNNGYTRALARVEQPDYDEVYSSSTMKVFTLR